MARAAGAAGRVSRVGRRRIAITIATMPAAAAKARAGTGPAWSTMPPVTGRAEGGADRLGGGEPREGLGDGAGRRQLVHHRERDRERRRDGGAGHQQRGAETEAAARRHDQQEMPGAEHRQHRDQTRRRRQGAALASQQDAAGQRAEPQSARNGAAAVACSGVPTVAVTATSSAPNSTPTASSTATSVRMPGRRQRAVARSAIRAGAQARDAGQRGERQRGDHEHQRRTAPAPRRATRSRRGRA